MRAALIARRIHTLSLAVQGPHMVKCALDNPEISRQIIRLATKQGKPSALELQALALLILRVVEEYVDCANYARMEAA